MVDTVQMRPIRETYLGDVRAVMEGEVEVSSLYDQFRAVFAAGNAHRLLAKPVRATDAAGRPALRWLSDAEGELVSFETLDRDEQDDLLHTARTTIATLFRMVQDNQSLSSTDRAMLLRALEKSFEIPDKTAICRVGGLPVLTEWGYVRTTWDAPRRLLRVLFEERLPQEGAKGSLTVRVLDGDGHSPVPGVRIEIESEAGDTVPPTVTDVQGMVRLTGLTISKPVAIHASDPHRGYALGHASAVVTAGLGQIVTIRAVSRRNIRLKVVDGTARSPCAGAALAVTLDGLGKEAPPIRETTDEAGACLLPAVPATASGLRIGITLASQRTCSVSLALSADQSDYEVVIPEPEPAAPWWSRARLIGALAALLLLLLGLAYLFVGMPVPVTVVELEAGTAFGAPADIAIPETGPPSGTRGRSPAEDAPPANGSLAFLDGGRVRYTPNPGFAGIDTFIHTVPATGRSRQQLHVRITVQRPDLRAVDDTVAGTVAGPLEYDVVANDQVVAAGAPRITAVTQPAAGTGRVDVLSERMVRYTPDVQVRGPVAFTYTLEDRWGSSSRATVSLNAATNRPPVAADDTFRTPQAGLGGLYPVLGNDQDADGDRILIDTVGTPRNGTAALSEDGMNILYRPFLGFSGTDEFPYVIRDGLGGTSSARIRITVPQAASHDQLTLPVCNRQPNGIQLMRGCWSYDTTLVSLNQRDEEIPGTSRPASISYCFAGSSEGTIKVTDQNDTCSGAFRASLDSNCKLAIENYAEIRCTKSNPIRRHALQQFSCSTVDSAGAVKCQYGNGSPFPLRRQ